MKRVTKITLVRGLGIIGLILASASFIISLRASEYTSAVFDLGFMIFSAYLAIK